MTTLERWTRVLAQPDPPEMIGRGHRVTCAGDPKRRQLVLKIWMAHLQYRYLTDAPDSVARVRSVKAAGRVLAMTGRGRQ